MTNYSSLTVEQHSQVAYLFADDVFNTDPSAFDYEVKDGNVIGRSRIAKSGDTSGRLKARKPHNIKVNVTVMEVPKELITTEMERNAAYAIQEIARSIVDRIIMENNQL